MAVPGQDFREAPKIARAAPVLIAAQGRIAFIRSERDPKPLCPERK
jgi:hypothetical protein